MQRKGLNSEALFDLPSVLDFLINADDQVQEAFFLTTVPSVIHFFGYGKDYGHADPLTFIASVAKKKIEIKLNYEESTAEHAHRLKVFFGSSE